MIARAPLDRTGSGLAPCGEGWFAARRRDHLVHPVFGGARRHGAGVEREAREPERACAGLPDHVAVACAPGDRPADRRALPTFTTPGGSDA